MIHETNLAVRGYKQELDDFLNFSYVLVHEYVGDMNFNNLYKNFTKPSKGTNIYHHDSHHFFNI